MAWVQFANQAGIVYLAGWLYEHGGAAGALGGVFKATTVAHEDQHCITCSCIAWCSHAPPSETGVVFCLVSCRPGVLEGCSPCGQGCRRHTSGLPATAQLAARCCSCQPGCRGQQDIPRDWHYVSPGARGCGAGGTCRHDNTCHVACCLCPVSWLTCPPVSHTVL